MKLTKGFWAIAIIVLLLTIDQIIKIWIKTHMVLYEDIPVT
ncbi:MAG: lipoprotein signal peptidase, partial [Dysgonamonadaceae bacterium]|nr:lipoprotein signal peptidase [Dysgonamonadaceae bacterium]